MDFHDFITLREACKRSGAIEDPDDFYQTAFADAVKMGSSQFYGQILKEREWEQPRELDWMCVL